MGSLEDGPSPEFESFKYGCFDPSFGASRDGLNVEAAMALGGSERREAERLILESLPETQNDRVFTAAGLMQIEAVVPILKSRLATGFKAGYESLRVHAALALHRLEDWPGAAPTILEVLQRDKPVAHQWPRMKAVEALAFFPEDVRVHEALFMTVEDDDSFIGFLAIRSLDTIFGGHRAIKALLKSLRETQIEPNRWQTEFLEKRRQTFHRLRRATGIRMPEVRMEPRSSEKGLLSLLVGYLRRLFPKDAEGKA